MPSPKAVLRDIADLGLDPKKSHSTTTKTGLRHGGRLSVATTPEEVTIVVEVVSAEEKPVAPVIEKKPARFEKKEKPVVAAPAVEPSADEKASESVDLTKGE